MKFGILYKQGKLSEVQNTKNETRHKSVVTELACG